MTDTDKIIEVIAGKIAEAYETGDNPYDAAVSITTAFREAGYTIEPDWSDDMEAAPKDGAPVQVAVPGYMPKQQPFFIAIAQWGKAHDGTETWLDAVDDNPIPSVTHWKPISPPQDAGKERE